MKSFSDIAETSYFQTIEFQKIHNFKRILEVFRDTDFQKENRDEEEEQEEEGDMGDNGIKDPRANKLKLKIH